MIAAGLIDALREVVPDGVLTAAEDLIAYGFDGTFYERTPPLVVLPSTTAQVCAIHRIATARRIPLTPRAMGSGLSGGAVPLDGSIVLGVSRMDRVLEISVDDGVAVVQPGVITAHLQALVEARGLFYPPDPSSLKQSAIGGNVAENAGGARALKYGVTGDYVLALEVVLPDGTPIRTGGRTVKNVTGYDLRRLFTGAEGTLGTITEITLKLLPKPRVKRTALAVFDRIADAADASTAVLAAGIAPAAIELLDALTMRCIAENGVTGLPLDADAILIFGADGNHESVVNEDIAAIGAVARAHGARTVTVAGDDAESERLWNARRSISPALARRRPNKLGEDVCVPRSKVTAMVARVRAIAAEHRLEIPLFGHIGDGNLHPNILCDKRDPEEMARVAAAARAIFEAAVELGGTLSGEHGIGLLKKQFMELDVGTDALALMRRIKAAVDPLGIMNPGKIFPEPGGADAFRL
ncbi:FAD-binding protein [Vulcanimicrobium alpinum]|uniref:FAD-binding protein n=1 Tax=Vulcanimicrobium alpinum TaxID=3016050 RepID=A0AAN1XTF1_UNVUL|nr:FAD-linked oxidase C-terminal domain-containing protein [Vulcanimicrobium alpinum]BDE04884.1 FAD-binding protein [Vulcanimicrobium alpinum]